MPNSWTAKQENDAVEAYLQYLATKNLPPDPAYARKVEVLEARIANEKRLFRKVALIAERQALESPSITPEDLVENFVKHAGGFSERNNITYTAWREMGVPAAVLEQVGIQRPTKREPRPEGKPSRVRRKMTPEFAAEYLAYFDKHGQAKAAERYGYVPHYAGELAKGLREKYPDA